jgi:hypothetical protein
MILKLFIQWLIYSPTINLHILRWSSEILPERLKSVCDGSEQSEQYKEELNRLVDRVGWEKVPVSATGVSAGTQAQV